MDIRRPGVEDLDAVKRLWACCFETEEEPFFQWFFSHRYCQEQALGVFEKGQLQSALHIKSYTLRLRGSNVPAGYIMGVGTFPEHRHKGYMTALLAEALADLRRQGKSVSFLLPRRPSIYTRHGWEICYHIFKYSLPVTSLPAVGDTEQGWHIIDSKKDIAQLNSIYCRYMEPYHGYVQRGEANWQELITENSSEAGQFYLLELTDGAGAYVMFIANGDRLLIKEMAYTCGKSRNRLLNFLGAQAKGYKRIEWQLPVSDITYLDFADERTGVVLYPFTSGRIVDVKQALSLYNPPASLSGTVIISITDKLAPWNHGIFKLTATGGKLSVEHCELTAGVLPDVEMTIGIFSQVFFGYADAEALAMSGRIKTYRLDGCLLLKQMFPRKVNMIYESF